jgi:hypothetical protein
LNRNRLHDRAPTFRRHTRLQRGAEPASAVGTPAPALDALGVAYEVLFINDGGKDRSAALLRGESSGARMSRA